MRLRSIDDESDGEDANCTDEDGWLSHEEEEVVFCEANDENATDHTFTDAVRRPPPATGNKDVISDLCAYQHVCLIQINYPLDTTSHSPPQLQSSDPHMYICKTSSACTILQPHLGDSIFFLSMGYPPLLV